MNKTRGLIILLLCIGISVLLHIYKRSEVPACMNADEAAFAYNAYSLLQTGADEYGKHLPLRLQSFDDYKLPLYSYLSIPFIKLLGTTESAIRMLNILVGILFVPLVYLISRELFDKKVFSYIATILTATSLWVYILTRHAHEAPLAALSILIGWYALLHFIRSKNALMLLVANIFFVLSTFAYHTGRIFLVFFILYQAYLLFKTMPKKASTAFFALVLVVSLVTPFAVDRMYGASRVQNLLFYKRAGFQARLDEYLHEHPIRLIHNKGTESAREITNRYLAQLSTEFFLISGDHNVRFGFENMPLITPVVYLFTIVGIAFLFLDKHRYRWLLASLLFISPIGNALTWQEASLTRVYFMIFPITIIAAYGIYRFIGSIEPSKIRSVVIAGIVAVYFVFLLGSLDTYFVHYFNRGHVVRSWQCGYKELFVYIEPKLKEYDYVAITSRHGQPYIFALYYLGIDPKKYQHKAVISLPDEYGFTQVLSYDKFVFKFEPSRLGEKGIFVAFPDEFKDTGISELDVKKIKSGSEEIFWVYENTGI